MSATQKNLSVGHIMIRVHGSGSGSDGILGHIVCITTRGVTCDCDAFVYRQGPVICEHMQFVRDLVGSVQVTHGKTVVQMMSPVQSNEA
jgi:hypothetical protein